MTKLAPRPPHRGFSQRVFDVIDQLGGATRYAVFQLVNENGAKHMSRKQVDAALSNLVNRGYVIRNSNGLYAKAPYEYFVARYKNATGHAPKQEVQRRERQEFRGTAKKLVEERKAEEAKLPDVPPIPDDDAGFTSMTPLELFGLGYLIAASTASLVILILS